MRDDKRPCTLDWDSSYTYNETLCGDMTWPKILLNVFLLYLCGVCSILVLHHKLYAAKICYEINKISNLQLDVILVVFCFIWYDEVVSEINSKCWVTNQT